MPHPQPPGPPAPSRGWHTPPYLHASSSIPAPAPPSPPPQVAASAAGSARRLSATPPHPHPPPPQHSPQGRRQTFPLITPPPHPNLVPLPMSNLCAQATLSPSPREIQPLRIFTKGVYPSPTAAREAALSFLRHLYDAALASAGGGGEGVCALASVVDVRSCLPDFVADVLRLWITVNAFLDGRNRSNETWAVGALKDVESVLAVIREEEEEEEEEGKGEGGWECVIDVAERTEDEIEQRWKSDSLFPLWNEVFDAWDDPCPLRTERPIDVPGLPPPP